MHLKVPTGARPVARLTLGRLSDDTNTDGGGVAARADPSMRPRLPESLQVRIMYIMFNSLLTLNPGRTALAPRADLQNRLEDLKKRLVHNSAGADAQRSVTR